MAGTGGPAPSIVEKLSGKRILLTGVTGFLGQVVFERLLPTSPTRRVTLLVRPQLGSTGRERVESLHRAGPRSTPCATASATTGILPLLDERVDVIDGDFGRGVPEHPRRHRRRDATAPPRSRSTRRSTRGS